MSRTARPRRGTKRSIVRGKYQPARFFPSCTIHGHTAAGGAPTVNARSITTSARPMMSSPARLAARSPAVAATEEKAQLIASNPVPPATPVTCQKPEMLIVDT